MLSTPPAINCGGWVAFVAEGQPLDLASDVTPPAEQNDCLAPWQPPRRKDKAKRTLHARPTLRMDHFLEAEHIRVLQLSHELNLAQRRQGKLPSRATEPRQKEVGSCIRHGKNKRNHMARRRVELG